jgi:hypothetical protein
MALVVGPLGCSSVMTRSVIPAASGLTAPAKPPTCSIDFFWTTPQRPYQELAAVSLVAAAGAGEYSAFQEALRVKACEMGGDAVIILLPFSSREGIIVKYSEIPEPPLVPRAGR